MARSIPTIQALIVANFQAQPELAAANSPAPRSIWRLLILIVATAINVFEQILDRFKADVTVIVALSAPGTPAWLIDKILNQFQYSATNPQIVVIGSNGVPYIPLRDPTLLLVTRCSVRTTISSQVSIKVAKQNPPVALLPGELAALANYVNTIGFLGIGYSVTSSNPDQVLVGAYVYYMGVYSAVILASVTASINSFLSNLTFDGILKVSDLALAIRNTVGVTDVLLQL